MVLLKLLEEFSMYYAADIISKKKYGKKLTHDEIKFMVDGFTNGNIPDYQMSAFLMAIYFKGMNDDESTYLAMAMRDSGSIFDLSSIKGVKVDKHSTGGVGDKVTLVLAPLVAYLGAKLAKMSGRGLGHTGGTIDKLEAIPGFKVELSLNEFENQVNLIGVAVVGQTGDVAPADKKIYALRDVTATVDSIPLIASSIMSKKLASGADAIVLDVKVGSGAFMRSLDDAKRLAKLMVSIGRLAGKHMTAILTTMDEPLGHKIGNALEVYESVETLLGKGPKDLVEITATIAGYLLVDAKIVDTYEQGYQLAKDTLSSGKAYSKFLELVEAQGGDTNVIKNLDMLIDGTKLDYLYAGQDGYVVSFDTLEIGKAAMYLGAGRATKDDILDLKVGLDLHKKIGDKVKQGDKLVTIYHHDKGLANCKSALTAAIKIGDDQVDPVLIYDIIK